MFKYKFPPTARLGEITYAHDGTSATPEIDALNDINRHREAEWMEKRVIGWPKRGRGSARAQFFDFVDSVLGNWKRVFENTHHEWERFDGFTIHWFDDDITPDGRTYVKVEFIEFHGDLANGKPGQPKAWAIWQDYREGSEDCALFAEVVYE